MTTYHGGYVWRDSLALIAANQQIMAARPPGRTEHIQFPGDLAPQGASKRARAAALAQARRDAGTETRGRKRGSTTGPRT